MFDASFPVAFGAGIVSFFAPCVVPLLPAYIGYVTGVSLKELKEKGYAPYRRKIISSSLFYILGFSIVFALMGTFAATLGAAITRNQLLVQRVGGVIILILGLEIAGLLSIPFFARERKFTLPAWVDKFGHLRAFIIGLIFAIAWTPCIGPILGGILALASTTGKAATGGLLLFVYSLGISVPFMIVSLTLASAPKYLSFISKYVGVVSRASGIILALLGILLMTNTYRFINGWLVNLQYNLGIGL